MTGSFQTARFLLAMAQEEAKRIAASAAVPVTAECELTEDAAGYVVTVRFRVPHAVADGADH